VRRPTGLVGDAYDCDGAVAAVALLVVFRSKESRSQAIGSRKLVVGVLRV